MTMPDGELDLFLLDVELALSAYGRDQLVVLWPRGAHLLARIVADHHAESPYAEGNRSPPPPAVTAQVAALFADRLGGPVTANLRTACEQPPGSGPEVVYRTEWDTLLLTVQGALRLRTCPFDDRREASAAGARGRPWPLSLRLRVGEAVYTPRGFMCELFEARTQTLLLELSLPGA